MLVKALVLDRDDRVGHRLGHFGQIDPDTVLGAVQRLILLELAGVFVLDVDEGAQVQRTGVQVDTCRLIGDLHHIDA